MHSTRDTALQLDSAVYHCRSEIIGVAREVVLAYIGLICSRFAWIDYSVESAQRMKPD